MYRKRRRNIIILFIAVILLLFACAQPLTVNTYTEESTKISAKVRIVLISDLHSTMYGKNQEELLGKIDEISPDLILLAGDIADDGRPHDGTEMLLKGIGIKYRCYYVSGNHEYRREVEQIKEMIRSYGVFVLEGDTQIIEINGQKLCICGVDDPSRYIEQTENSGGLNDALKIWDKQIEQCYNKTDESIYSILVSHRPSFVEYYEKYKFDLIVCGHEHGGQVRIPFILDGLLAPDEGLFPKYAGGKYKLKNSTMVVSRGLARNEWPRVFNPPEIVVIELDKTN